MVITTDWTLLTHLEEGGTANELRANEIADVHDALLKGGVEDRDENDGDNLTPSDGQLWIVAATPAGAWSPFAEHDLVLSINSAWIKVTPQDGTTFWLKDESCYVRYDSGLGTWVANGKVTDAITASVTQTQGQQPLDYGFSRLSVVANANDTVTLPASFPGARVVVRNDGANTAQIFPASGGDIDGAATNAADTLAAASSLTYFGVDSTSWYTH